jgi:hypothetical protein
LTLEIELGDWDRLAARPIFGNRDVAEVVSELVPTEECFFLASSAGMLFGLRLTDGSRVALKAVRPRPGLDAARDVQRALYERGYPCPRPLRGPLPLGDGYAFVDEWVDGLQQDVHEPRRRRESAHLLAELISLAPQSEHLPRSLEAKGLFPEPHHARFDFDRPDGVWIDRIAARARDVRGEKRLVTGHSDWSAKHFGWEGDRVVVVYDWPDSVARDAEETFVGQASASFPATWDLPVAPKAATPEESEAFVDEYEGFAGRRLDRRAVATARVYFLAYCARCELSDLDGEDGDFQAALRAQA